ncbi:MAG: di-heme oxidoredictase family protein, partial [Pseudomonadota bacterium]
MRPLDLSSLEDVHLPVVPRTAKEAARIAAVTALTDDFSAAQRFEMNSGGAGTIRPGGGLHDFSQISANLPFEAKLDFNVGRGLFKKLWISSPSSTLASDGLGPLFNARSCARCHVNNARGHPPEGPGDNSISMLMRVSIPDPDPEAGLEDFLASVPDPNYGTQIQDHGTVGQTAEAQLSIAYEEVAVPLSGGEIAFLRTPTYELSDLGYGPLHAGAMLSPRIAPQMIGLGLLEAVPTADIVALADPDDADGDGISGRASVVWSEEFGQWMLGRFGHKAMHPTLYQQNADAFSGDVGISSPLFPAPWGNCTEAQTACRTALHGDGDLRVFEIDHDAMESVTFFTRNLAVPARRNVGDAQVLRGKAVFNEVGCAGCHRPSFVTHRLDDQPAQADCGPESAELRPVYNTASDAWTRVSHLRFGPSEEEERGFALAFWPDPRGSTPKTLATLLRDADPVVDTSEEFATVSVAGRGFYAMEFLLYDAQFTGADDAAYVCALTQAVARDIAASSAAIEAEWAGGYAALMTAPGNDIYRTEDEALRQLFTALSTGL